MGLIVVGPFLAGGVRGESVGVVDLRDAESPQREVAGLHPTALLVPDPGDWVTDGNPDLHESGTDALHHSGDGDGIPVAATGDVEPDNRVAN